MASCSYLLAHLHLPEMQDTYYDMQPDIAPVTFQSDKTLKLQSVSVKGLQSGRSLVIEKATNPVQYQEVRGHLWHVAPSTLIENAISDVSDGC